MAALSLGAFSCLQPPLKLERGGKAASAHPPAPALLPSLLERRESRWPPPTHLPTLGLADCSSLWRALAPPLPPPTPHVLGRGVSSGFPHPPTHLQPGSPQPALCRKWEGGSHSFPSPQLPPKLESWGVGGVVLGGAALLPGGTLPCPPFLWP